MPDNNNTPTWWQSTGREQTGGLVSQALNGIMGIFLGKSQDKRQIKQQQKLQDMQIAGSKQMTDYNMGKQLEMWKATGPTGMKEQLKEAGLNPGLMYGMSGGGGQTVGSAAGNVSGGTAPSGGREVQDMMGMGLMNAQKQLIEAQANNLNADTENKRGAERENTQASTGKLIQETDNARTQQKLMKVQTEIAEFQRDYDRDTFEQRTDNWNYIIETAQRQLGILTNEGTILENTVNERIETVKEQLALIVAQKESAQAGKALTEAQAKKVYADIRAKITELEQGDRALDQEDKNLIIKEATNAIIKEGIYVGAASRVAGDMVDIIMKRGNTKVGTKN